MAYTVTDLLRLDPGPVRLADHDPGATPGFEGSKKDGGEGAARSWARSSPTSRSGCTPTPTPAAAAACCSCSRAWTPRARAGSSTTRSGCSAPTALRLTSFKKPTEEELAHDFLWRIDQALPLRRDGGGLRPLPLRGRAGGARCTSSPTPRRSSGATTRSTTWEKALVDDGHRRPQVHAARLRRGAEGAAARPAGRPREAVEVQARRTSTSGPAWATTRRPTRSRWSAAAPTPRPGTSSRATTSGTATGPSASCCSRPCAG